jgi:hypothetical protein
MQKWYRIAPSAVSSGQWAGGEDRLMLEAGPVARRPRCRKTWSHRRHSCSKGCDFISSPFVSLTCDSVTETCHLKSWRRNSFVSDCGLVLSLMLRISQADDPKMLMLSCDRNRREALAEGDSEVRRYGGARRPVGLARAWAGPGKYSSPRHRIPFDSRERNAFACIERHQAFALAPVPFDSTRDEGSNACR